MKRLLTIILAVLMVLSFAACKDKPADDVSTNDVETQQTADNKDETEEKDTQENETEEKADEKEDESTDKADATAKPTAAPTAKPTEKPAETTPEAKPEATAKPTATPAAKPTATPEPTKEPETKKSVANILLADFKAKANSGDALSIAEELIGNSVIAFSGGAMPVEPGYLTGFGNTEIKGFKEGAMFAPMIGTIPFVGYVFTLEDSANVSSFIATLKSEADLRWNICTSADEMVTGSVGNKVFFVMSPISFEE